MRCPIRSRSPSSGGIGLFIAFIGAQNAGVVVDDRPRWWLWETLTQARAGSGAARHVDYRWPAGFAGARRDLVGHRASTGLGMVFGLVPLPTSVVEWPRFSDWAPVFGKLDIVGALKFGFLEIVLVFLFVDMFDTVGTLIGVSTRAGFLDEHGRLPRASQALMADAIGTMGGSVFGTPTVTTYVESTSGVAAGGRTGLTAMTVAVLFLLSLLFTPLVGLVADVPSRPRRP